MSVPLGICGGSVQALSRISFGGLAVLDSAHTLRDQNRGAHSKETLCLLPTNTTTLSNKKRALTRDSTESSLGLGDFDAAVDARDSQFRQQSVGQMEAPSYRRPPILHRAESGRLMRVRIEARRSTVSNTTFLLNTLEASIEKTA